MKYTKLFIVLASVFVSFTACSSGDDGDEPTSPTPTNPTNPTNPTERKLVIEVSANPWLDENGNARETRGDVITTQTLKNFTIDYWLNSDNNHFSVSRVGDNINNSWIPTPESESSTNWPSSLGNNDPISFYAHTAGTCNNESGYYVAFNSEEASGFQHDLLLSKITDVTYSGTGGVIWFTFDHACAAVDFNIQITNKLWTQLGTDLTVNSVVLKNIAKTGECYYSTGSGIHIGQWKNVGVPHGNDESGYTNYTLTQSAITVKNDLQPLPCNTMFIIPQTLGEFAGLEVSYTFSNQTNTTAWIPLQGTKWEAGHLYPINIVLGTSLIK